MAMRIVLLAVVLGLVAVATPSFVPGSPVGTASAYCAIILPDGGCTNPCFIVAGVVHKVDPKQPVVCPE
jgi:hypothetical protein